MYAIGFDVRKHKRTADKSMTLLNNKKIKTAS